MLQIAWLRHAKEINMELSVNWKKLKATLDAGTTKIQISKQLDHETSGRKRKQPPSSGHKTARKLASRHAGDGVARDMTNEYSIDSHIGMERVNAGLSERYARPEL